MPKARKPASKPESSPVPQVGDKVIPERSDSTWVITHVSPSGEEVNLNLEGTNLDRFRVRANTLKFVDRAPRNSKPAVEAQPRLNSTEVLNRIGAVQKENLQRLDDDIAILSKYLRTEGASKNATEVLNQLSNEQHASWQTAVEQIEEFFEDYEV
jgi:hypothetical protein